MHFKTPYIEAQYPSLNVELRAVLADLDNALHTNDIASFAITEAFRRQVDHSHTVFKRLLKSGMPAKEAQRRADQDFTYHFTGDAVDFRSCEKELGRMYTPKERKFIFDWLVARCPHPKWDVLEHDAGTGIHFHVELNNTAAKEAWLAKRKSVA